jgi:hypothetical protein
MSTILFVSMGEGFPFAGTGSAPENVPNGKAVGGKEWGN